MHTMPDVEGLDSEAMYQILTPVQEESAANEIHWARDCNSTVVRETITEITYETLEQEQLAGEYGFIGAYTTVRNSLRGSNASFGTAVRSASCVTRTNSVTRP